MYMTAMNRLNDASNQIPPFSISMYSEVHTKMTERAKVRNRRWRLPEDEKADTEKSLGISQAFFYIHQPVFFLSVPSVCESLLFLPQMK